MNSYNKNNRTDTNYVVSAKKAYIPARILSGASLKTHNDQINKLLETNGIKATVSFDTIDLGKYIKTHGTFGKGLLEYLLFLEQQLNDCGVQGDLKNHIWL